jgi:hypothetical protein
MMARSTSNPKIQNADTRAEITAIAGYKPASPARA